MDLHERSADADRRISTAARIAGIVCYVVIVVACFGCMSIGGRTEIVNHDDHSRTQNGKATLSSQQTLDIYYPVPFGSPPNLEIEAPGDACAVIEQKADHFCVKNMSQLTRAITWTARGVAISPSAVQSAVPSQAD